MGACQNITDVSKEYHVTIVALQEIKWTETGQIKYVNEYIIFYREMESIRQLRTGFTGHKDFELYAKEFNPLSMRI